MIILSKYSLHNNNIKIKKYTLGVQRIKSEKERETTNMYVCVKKKVSKILKNVKIIIDQKRSNK